MSDITPLDRIRREKQLFFINSTQIPGIQSIQTQSDFGKSPIEFLGNRTINFGPSGPQVSNVNISSLLISSDQFIQYTGNVGFNGYILKSKSNISENYSFISGYLNSYSSKCSIGEIPQIDVSLSIYQKMGRIPIDESPEIFSQLNLTTNENTIPLRITGPGSITFDTVDFLNNRVNSYDLSIKCNRLAAYRMGSRNPYAINLIFPQDITLLIEMEIENYTPKNTKEFPVTNTTISPTLTITDYETNASIITYSFSDMALVEENYNISVDGNATVNAVYKTLKM